VELIIIKCRDRCGIHDIKTRVYYCNGIRFRGEYKIKQDCYTGIITNDHDTRLVETTHIHIKYMSLVGGILVE